VKSEEFTLWNKAKLFNRVKSEKRCAELWLLKAGEQSRTPGASRSVKSASFSHCGL